MAKKPVDQMTPMMRQYFELKEQHPDCLLLFRLGDFYELFFDDAITASKELEIVLTGRNCGMEERAPMCGVPYHAVASYADRLIEKGYKVAICEQLTDPTLSKGLVERGVIRIITPGTVTDEAALDEKTNNYVMSLCLDDEGGMGFSFADVSTGAFSLGEIDGENKAARLFEELARIEPTEVIINSTADKDAELLKKLKSRCYVYTYADWAFDASTSRKNVLAHFRLSDLRGYGCEDMKTGVRAAGALLAYLNETQKNALEHITAIDVYRRFDYMALDETTRANLELTRSIRGGKAKKSTLLGLLDRTKTAMGGRMLRSWVNQPLTDRNRIINRQDAVAAFSEAELLRDVVAANLEKVYDLERICSKISYNSLNARDALSLRNSLAVIPAIKSDILAAGTPVIARVAERIDALEDIHSLLERAIAEEPPALITEGGIIKQGYNSQIDELRNAERDGRNWLEDLVLKEREATGIKNLKINFNKVFGYYIEVTRSYYNLVPLRYERKQTLANAERFITPELKELEEKILGASEKAVTLEYKVFVGIRELLSRQIKRVLDTAAVLAELDCLQSLAAVANANGYVRPELTGDGVIDIKDGRHPVVEKTTNAFVPNDTLLDPNDNRLMIITGPNMAGKSTYMRQVALIVLMAHIGSFVPARHARITLTDRIFTRVGASDDLASGQSTFMVEMSETANILNNATKKSLLLLDEIGRGTSTFDGLSIAWAVVEYIADKSKLGAKTLFATHYHEISELQGIVDGVVNYRITAREVGEDVIFLRKVVRGGTDKSFGIQVARLAGVPRCVIERAKVILDRLVAAEINRTIGAISVEKAAPLPEHEALLSEIAAMNVDDITPFEALSSLYELKERAKAALKTAERKSV